MDRVMFSFSHFKTSAISMFLLLTLIIILPDVKSSTTSTGDIVSRQKRYVAFPEGASLTMALCMSQQTILPFQIFTEGVNWGIAYELPNRTTFLETIKLKKHIVKRRHRRELYNRIELVLDNLGFDGKACVYRALCEAPLKFLPKGITLSEEIVRLLFSFPRDSIDTTEPEEHRLYHWASRQGQINRLEKCEELFAECQFSLIDVALGRYDEDVIE